MIEKLENMLENKSRKVFRFFDANALSKRHSEVFRDSKPCSRYTKFKRVDNYIVIRTRKWDLDRMFYYHAVFVVGVDDTTHKLFCHRLPWEASFEEEDFLSQLNLRRVRKLMGYDLEKDEMHLAKQFDRIRLQGDLFVEIHKIFQNENELYEYLKEKVLELKADYYFDKVNESTIMTEIDKLLDDYRICCISRKRDECINRMKRYIIFDFDFTERDEFDIYNYGYEKMSVDEFSSICRKLVENKDETTKLEIESKLKELEFYAKLNKKLFLELLYQKFRELSEMLDVEIKVDINKIVRKRYCNAIYIRQVIKNTLKNKLSEHAHKLIQNYIDENEKILNINVGNHNIRIVAIPDVSHSFSAMSSYFIILRPQFIEIEHHEHGLAKVYVPKPCVLRFDVLRRHIRG